MEHLFELLLPGLPELASEHGARVDLTLGWIHLLMLALFLFWGVFFVYVLWRFRHKRQPLADPRGPRSRFSTWIEMGVVAAEAALLLGLSIPLYSARIDQIPPEDEATVVRVVGQQYAWNVHYPGPDGLFGLTRPDLVSAQNPLGLDRDDPAAADDVTTLNQLHLPVGRPALIHLSSQDVIHSFSLPELRVKRDAIPGLSFPVWFVPTVTTEEMRRLKGDGDFAYEIGCAQLCGLGHYRMKGFLTIHPPEEFAAWMEEQQEELQDDGEDDFWS